MALLCFGYAVHAFCRGEYDVYAFSLMMIAFLIIAWEQAHDRKGARK